MSSTGSASAIKAALAAHANPHAVADLQRFFKTAEGEYGEGDVFVGVKVPAIRLVSKQFAHTELSVLGDILDSPVHEHRMCALIILTLQYPRATDETKQKIYELYLQKLHENRINNWDLVDVTCRATVGAHLYQRPRDPLFVLASSASVWERRTAVIAPFFFLAKVDPSTTLDVSEQLLNDSHHLIQKAVGWGLREMGKRVDERLLIDFLDVHASVMPRTMLRYAIERLPEKTRRYYMEKH